MRRYVALTPTQKRRKKDWLVEQQRDRDDVPTLLEVFAEHEPREYENAAHTTTYFDLSLLLAEQLVGDDATHAELYEARQLVHDEALMQTRTELAENYRDEYEAALTAVDALHEEDMVYRVITIDGKVDPASLNGLGVFWSSSTEGAYAYWGKKKGRQVLLRAVVDPDAVDRRGTIFARTHPDWGHYEDEVRFYKHAPLYVIDAEYLDTGEIVEINDWRRA